MKMSITILGFLGMLMFGGLTMHSEEKTEKAMVEIIRLTEQDLESNPRLKELEPGHPKALLKFYNFPVDKEFKIILERTIFPNPIREVKGRMTMHQDGSLWIGNTPHIPFFPISARGFLPGEVVKWHFETEDQSFHYEMNMMPNLIRVEIPDQELTAQATLISITPAFYKIQFQGIKEGATVHMLSTSEGESLKHSFPWKKGQPIQYSPDVVGKKGGASHLTFSLDNGEKVEFTLPWGKELLGYLKGDKIYGQE